MKKSTFFWVSYSDLMTSLFFIMLVLYIVSFVLLNKETQSLKVKAHQLKQIEDVEQALSRLNPKYFQFDNSNKRYQLSIDIRFNPNSANISNIPASLRHDLVKAGKNLHSTIREVIKLNPGINYLLVIEGNTQRSNQNWMLAPDVGYELSYKRALSLYNYWLHHDIDFRTFGPQCEVILAGSGYFSHSRDAKNENNNRRFSIQITSKVGQFLQSGESYEINN